MLTLFERSLWGGTNAFYGMSKLIFVQKLSHFEVRDFGRISYKKTDKIDILRYFTPNVSAPSIFVQISWDLHQMTSSYWEIKLRRIFWKFWKLAILCYFCTKDGRNFRHFEVQHGFFDPDPPIALTIIHSQLQFHMKVLCQNNRWIPIIDFQIKLYSMFTQGISIKLQLLKWILEWLLH